MANKGYFILTDISGYTEFVSEAYHHVAAGLVSMLERDFHENKGQMGVWNSNLP